MKITKTMITGLASLVVATSANAGVLYAIDNASDHLFAIDTSSLALTDIGALGTNASFAGAAYDANSETLYMIGGRSNNSLYTVDTNTGAATTVGSHGVDDLFGLAYDTSTDTLYGSQFSGGSGLYSLNTSNGSATTINSAMINPIGGLAYNSAVDALIGMHDGAGDLFSIDRSNGAQTLLHNGDFVNDSGLTYDPDLDIYWDIDYSGNLYSYDPNMGYARTTHLTGLGNFDGMAYRTTSVNAVPEPANLALFGLGALMMGLVRRRKS